jgi:hypothetical protein
MSETVSINNVIAKIQNKSSANHVSVNHANANHANVNVNVNANANEYSATSPMVGGGAKLNHSETSDIQQLVSMLASETETAQLENKLQKDLTGGSNVESVRTFFNKLQQNGVNVEIKLNGLTFSEFFKNDNVHANANNLTGGAKVMTGGLNDALAAFQKLRKFVSDELGIKGVRVTAKVASKLKKDVEAKNSGKSPMEIAKLAMDHFKSHRDTFVKLAKELEKSS